MIKKILYALGAIALLIGLYGFYGRLFVGEREVNYGSYFVWGLWVAMYLFFAGVSSGCYMVATLDYLFEIPLFKGTGKYALLGSLVTLPAALTSIGFDLGHMERIWKVYLNPNFTSLMAQMVWSYTLFGIIILATFWLVIHPSEQKWLFKGLLIVGFVMAIFVSGGVGALLGVNASRAVWHVGLLPAQFPFFSLASGVALLFAVISFFGDVNDSRRPQQLRVLGIGMIILLLIKTYFLWADFSMSLYAGVPQNVDAINEVLYGQYWWSFWIFQIVLGTIVPLILLVIPSTYHRSPTIGWIGVLVLIGFAAARANIIFPALSIPELEGLATAFTGPHLSFEYFPSLMEWSVTLGVVGAATLAFLIGIDYLPLYKNEVSK